MTPTLHVAPSRPVHRPIATGAPDEPRRLCRTCRVDWPCEGGAVMAEFFFKGNQKVTFIPYVSGEIPTVGHLMSEEEQACDCGCMDIEREPLGDITYWVEPEPRKPPEFLTSPGVTSAWFLLDGEYVPVAIMSSGDGKANVMRTDL